jgi:hypothetical protein
MLRVLSGNLLSYVSNYYGIRYHQIFEPILGTYGLGRRSSAISAALEMSSNVVGVYLERDKRGAPSAILFDIHRSEFRQTRHRLYHQRGGTHLSSHLTSSTDRIRTQRKSKALGWTIGGDQYYVSQRWRLIGRPSPASILHTRMPSSQEQGCESWPVVTRSPTKSAKAMANERRRCISRPSNEPADSSEAHRRQGITAKARP